MNTYISLLRGINVGGHKKIAMAELRQQYEKLGFENVRSYIQSGNVVFNSSETNSEELAGQIERAIRQKWAYDVVVFLRTVESFARLISANPFVIDRDEDKSKLHVTFLKKMPPVAVFKALDIPDAGNDEYAVGANEIYFYCPDGYGRTKYSNPFIERKLKTQATARNWRTVNKLYKMARESD